MRLLLFAALVVLLVITNPGPDEFAEFVEDNVAEQIARESEALPGGGILGELGGLAASRIARQVARRDNYLVASVYTLDLDGRARDAEDWKFLGVGTLFFEIRRPESLR